MKLLLLMRHAKSDWSADFERDHDRPLNQRGVRSARLMGRLLSSRKLAPDLVISSTADRARSTAEIAIESGAWACRMELEDSLYSSGVRGVIDVARSHLEPERLMLVGHQPTWSMAVADLSGERVEMKTGSVAVLSWPSGTAPLTLGAGVVTDVLSPRDFFGSSYDE